MEEMKGLSSSRFDRQSGDGKYRPVQHYTREQRLNDHLANGGPLDNPANEKQTGISISPSSNATICTIITANYLPYAKALLESVRVFEPDVHFNIFISDQEPHQFTEEVNDDYVFFHFSDEICHAGIGQQIRNKYQYADHDAFRWSCKPIFINHLIRQQGYEQVLYFDSDIYIFDDFRFLFEALKKHEVLLTPHWRTRMPETDPDEYRFLFNHGLYNAGFIGANTLGTKAMDWWAGCCLHSCARGSFEGEFVDQSILNLMPVYFEGVHVLRHKGCNVAIWNRHECQRVWQADGSVKIDNHFPIVFIHFSAGIPRFWDPMIGTYLDRYLTALKRYDPQTWARELDKRNPTRDTYIEQKSKIYLQIKRSVVQIRLTWFPYRSMDNIAILAQSGTSQQCLGLWLRQVPGTLLSGIPIADWKRDGIDTLDHKIETLKSPEKSDGGLEQLLISAMKGFNGDMAHVNWAHWRSLISKKRMVMNFPESSLCWPEMAEIIGRRHQVIALVSHPARYAQRMMAIFGNGKNLHCMESALSWMQQYPSRPSGLEDMSFAEFTWIIKWCLDLKQLEQAAETGKRIHFVREEDLMSDTRTAIDQLFKQLGLICKKDIATSFQTFCRYRHHEFHAEEGDLSTNLMHRRQAIDRFIQSFGIYTYNENQHK